MQIHLVTAELFLAGGRTGGRTDGQTDRQTNMPTHVTKLIVAFRNFANWPKMAVHVFRKFWGTEIRRANNANSFVLYFGRRCDFESAEASVTGRKLNICQLLASCRMVLLVILWRPQFFSVSAFSDAA
jgi:hypothetical protein